MEDEFEGTELNTTLWTAKTGRHTTSEGEWYLPEQVSVSNGHLVLTANVSEDPARTGGKKYLSGWVDTHNKWFSRFGRFEAHCAYYIGAEGHSFGMWPAYWLMPQGGGCWPVSGEIDVMESLGGRTPTLPWGTYGEEMYHWGTHWAGNQRTCGYGREFNRGKWIKVDAGAGLFNTTMHTFGVNFDNATDTLYFYLDGQPTGYTPDWNGKKVDAPHPWYHIVNLSVGGLWGGFPLNSTHFPQTMQCDWVRHYSPITT